MACGHSAGGPGVALGPAHTLIVGVAEIAAAVLTAHIEAFDGLIVGTQRAYVLNYIVSLRNFKAKRK